MIKRLTSALLFLLLITACKQETSEEYTGNVERIFSEISVSEDLNLFVDESGQLADGHYTAYYQNGSIQADVTFKNGMISEGGVFSPNGVQTIRYTTENGFMKVSYYNKRNSHPRVVALYGNNLSDRIEFHTWDEDGTQRVKHNQVVMKLLNENGQPMFEMSLRDGEGHGKYVSWFENGQIKSEGYFTDGVKNGTFKEWDEKGNVVSMQVYDMGELVSENE